MKTVITASGNSVHSSFDQRFGRAGWFCLYDHQTKHTTFYQNSNVDTKEGAGLLAAKKMAEIDAQRVISGDIGAKAKVLLDKLSIQIVLLPYQDLTIGAIIEKLS